MSKAQDLYCTWLPLKAKIFIELSTYSSPWLECTPSFSPTPLFKGLLGLKIFISIYTMMKV